jgi:hypothetical protein
MPDEPALTAARVAVMLADMGLTDPNRREELRRLASVGEELGPKEVQPILVIDSTTLSSGGSPDAQLA